MELLTREEFKRQVFIRDALPCPPQKCDGSWSLCVKCKEPAVDAHHLIDRILWGESGGYYLSNGVSLCDKCHFLAEQTILSCKELRELAGIQEIVLPEHFFTDENYDKWGNILLPSGMRIKGELFGEENVQKILPSEILSLFLPYVKYPRTYHLPWSENLQNDDRMHDNIEFFNGKEIVGTIKVDGECTSMYENYCHARSLDSQHHESRAWVKALHGRIAHEIPYNWRICGENLFARHSIHYHHLSSYFLVYSIWNENNIALSWDETVQYCDILGLPTVPVFYRGVWGTETRTELEKAFKAYQDASQDPVEGYVVRVTGRVPYKDYRRSFSKWVRKGHVQTSVFWMREKVVPNELEIV